MVLGLWNDARRRLYQGAATGSRRARRCKTVHERLLSAGVLRNGCCSGSNGVFGGLAIKEAGYRNLGNVRPGDEAVHIVEAYLNVPLTPLQQRYGIFDFLICDGGELLERKLLLFGELCDIDPCVRH